MRTDGEAARVLRGAVGGSLLMAALAGGSLSLLGRPAAGAALAAGLLLGAVNGPWIRRSLGTASAFWLASMGRLGALSLAAVGIGFALGTELIWLTVAGVAFSQIILAGASARQGMAA